MKQKEQILEQEIIDKKKQVNVFETQIFDSVKIQRSTSIDDTSLKLKQYEFRLKELKKENLSLKDKIGSTELSVISFISEINEVLDNHEIASMFIDQNLEQRKEKEQLKQTIQLGVTANLGKRNFGSYKKSTKFVSRKSIKSNFLAIKMNVPKKSQSKLK